MDFYDRAEAGSTWQIAIPGSSHTDCPEYATRTVRVPDGTIACEPGCTCSFHFELDDNGDLGHDYDVLAFYYEDCSSGVSLDCVDTDPVHHVGGAWCNPDAYCSYGFELTELPQKP